MPKVRGRLSESNGEMHKLRRIICSSDGRYDTICQSGNNEPRSGTVACHRHTRNSGTNLGSIHQRRKAVDGIIINRHSINHGGHATVGGSQEDVGIQPTQKRGPRYRNDKRQGNSEVLQGVSKGKHPSSSPNLVPGDVGLPRVSLPAQE